MNVSLNAIAQDLLPTQAMVKRELISTLRLHRTFIFVVLTVVISAVFPVGMWPTETTDPAYMVGLSEEIFAGIAFTLLIATALMIPATAGSALIAEREEGTLDLLATTHAKVGYCVLAKFINGFGMYALLAIAVLPVLALVSFSVGLNQSVVFEGVLVLTSFAISLSGIGLLCAARIRAPHFALGGAYLCTLVLTGLPVLLLIVVLQILRFGSADRFIIATMESAFSFFTMIAILEGRQFGGISPAYIHLVIHGVIGIGALMLAIALLRREWRGLSGVHRLPNTTVKTVRRGKKIRSDRSIRDWQNPVFVKDALWDFRVVGRGGLVVAVCTFALALPAMGILMLLPVIESPYLDESLPAWLALQAVLAALAVPALTIHAFNKERMHGTWDGLRTSLMRDAEVVRGKTWAALAIGLSIVVPAWVAALPLFWLDGAMDAVGYQVGAGLVLLGVCVLISAVITLFASQFFHRIGTGLVASYLILFLIGFGLCFATLVAWQLMERDRNRFAEIWILSLSPIIAYLESDWPWRHGSKPWSFCLSLFAYSITAFVCWFAVLRSYRRRFRV